MPSDKFFVTMVTMTWYEWLWHRYMIVALRVYLWWNNVCPEHGPMNRWESPGGGGWTCGQCDAAREQAHAERVTRCMQGLKRRRALLGITVVLLSLGLLSCASKSRPPHTRLADERFTMEVYRIENSGGITRPVVLTDTETGCQYLWLDRGVTLMPKTCNWEKGH